MLRHRRRQNPSLNRRIFGLLTAICCSTAVLFVVGHSAAAANYFYPSGSTGTDVSWPPSNCSATPPNSAAFGIVGVTGGLDFTPNHCLFSESHRFVLTSLYMNTGFPGAQAAQKYAGYPRQCPKSDNDCLAYNYGFAAAQYALLYATSQNVYSTSWWLDVETDNSWTSDQQQNRSSLDGMIAAIRQNTFLSTTGIYSTPKQWKQIMGDWKNGLPNWVGTGSPERQTAITACNDSNFTGGDTWLTQYVLSLDHDYVCAPAPAPLLVPLIP